MYRCLVFLYFLTVNACIGAQVNGYPSLGSVFEERSPRVKAPGESQVQPLSRDRGRGGGGAWLGAEHVTERQIINFVKMKVLKKNFNPKFMFRHVPSRALGSYAPDIGIKRSSTYLRDLMYLTLSLEMYACRAFHL